MLGWIKSLFSNETVLLRVTIPVQSPHANAAELSQRDSIVHAINQMNFMDFERTGESPGAVFFEYRGSNAKESREFLSDVLQEEGIGTVTMIDETQ